MCSKYLLYFAVLCGRFLLAGFPWWVWDTSSEASCKGFRQDWYQRDFSANFFFFFSDCTDVRLLVQVILMTCNSSNANLSSYTPESQSVSNKQHWNKGICFLVKLEGQEWVRSFQRPKGLGMEQKTNNREEDFSFCFPFHCSQSVFGFIGGSKLMVHDYLV